MIFKRLKKSTPEEEKEFSNMMEEEKVGWKDRLAMMLSAYVVIVIPCLLILIFMCVFMLWVFGLL